MSATKRFITSSSLFKSPLSSSSSSNVYFLSLQPPRFLSLHRTFLFSSSSSSTTTMPPRYYKRKGGNQKDEKWIVKSAPGESSSVTQAATANGSEGITQGVSAIRIQEMNGLTHASVPSIQAETAVLQSRAVGPGQVWKPKSYGTLSGVSTAPANEAAAGQKEMNGASLSFSMKGKLLENFTVDNSTYSQAKVRATFYPKFENEKSDQEIRTRMIEMVSNGLATLEVSLKHSGSLFMYAGHEGGAYAKNSFGNIYTAVGVFVLGRMFREAWGTQASKKQAEFNEFLENNHMCISMELVTAVLGDHGQRPRDDYVVVTAVTELGVGKPKFYSTPEVIAFCRKWRLPTNYVWLFSTRKSVTSFFTAFDALCEEGTATSVCKALDEVADICIPGSKDHIEVQGEILEGLVARIVSPKSSQHMQEVLQDYPPPPIDGANLDLGPTLREICAANRADEKQQIKALLKECGTSFCPDHADWLGREAGDASSRVPDKSGLTKFLQAHPADYSTHKVQEMIRLMKDKRFPASFKCYYNLHRAGSMSKDDIYYKMVIHVHSDSTFRRYHKEMRHNHALWPLYRGFFVDVNLYKESKEKSADTGLKMSDAGSAGVDEVGGDALADEDANLMVKLKFLTYKLRTFLIRNGLSTLFKEGPSAYKAYYLRQMKIWGTSAAKQKELSKMLDEWAVHIRRKCGMKQLKSDIYLSEAEPFLEQYARRSPANQVLIGSAGSLVRSEDFMAIVGDVDEEGDLDRDRETEPSTPPPSTDTIQKEQGLIVFFPGIPGCAKSALCKELLKAPGGFGDNRPVHTLMGDLIKGRYWQKVAEQCKRKRNSIMLADKNAPNEEVWRQIEDMCGSTRSNAVPVVADSEGTDSNPFSLDALAVFMFRVLQRVNHPGNLDKASPNAGYVLLMFYNLYEGKSRREFEGELVERFGSVVKMPLLKSERPSLPDSVKTMLEEGLNLYRLHTKKHGRMDSTKGTYAKDWMKWEKDLRETLSSNVEHLNSIQVPFESAVNSVMEQLKTIAKGDYVAPTTERKRLGVIIYAGVSLPVTDICGFINDFAKEHPEVETFFKDKGLDETLRKAHVTLAHKRSHGVTAVANYGQFVNRKVPVEFTALLYTDKMAALEARIGSVDGEQIISKNEWPHATLWTAAGVSAKEANTLPHLASQGEASRIEIDPPVGIVGEVEFF